MRIYLADANPARLGEAVEGGCMKVYLADSNGDNLGKGASGVFQRAPVFRILISYWYYQDVDLDEMLEKYFPPDYPIDIFADSGAFSGMTQGAPIDIDQYAAWVKKWQHRFTVYANLDVIKDAVGTHRNQKYLEDTVGLSPLPVFHILEDWKYLDDYVRDYPYIALGVAGQQTRRDAVMRFLIQCFRVAGTEAVFHGFGLTSWEVMRSFKWYSVDSSSWGKGFRFGKIPLFDERIGRFVEVQLGDRKSAFKYGTLISKAGFDPLDFGDRSRNDRTKIAAISAYSYMRAEQWLQNRYGNVEMPQRGRQVVRPDNGFKVYLADSTAPDHFDLGKVYRFYEENNNQQP